MDERFIIEENRIYIEDEKGEMIAEITYPEASPGVFVIDHTYVSEVLRGEGLAAKLVEAAVGEIEKKGGKVQATCSYAKKLLNV